MEIVEQTIAIVLRFAATGEIYRALEHRFRVSHSLIRGIMPEVIEAIYQQYQDAIKCPTVHHWNGNRQLKVFLSNGSIQIRWRCRWQRHLSYT